MNYTPIGEAVAISDWRPTIPDKPDKLGTPYDFGDPMRRDRRTPAGPGPVPGTNYCLASRFVTFPVSHYFFFFGCFVLCLIICIKKMIRRITKG